MPADPRLRAVVATATARTQPSPSVITALCTSLQQRVFSAEHVSIDSTGLLGMVNVACVQYRDATSAAMSNVHACTSSHRAFVVGINSYSSVRRLRVCVQDAKDMGSLLDSVGYDVVQEHDVSRSMFVTAFDAFCDSLTSDTAKVVVHFSGHGASPNGEQFLLAADSTSECDLQRVGEMVAAVQPRPPFGLLACCVDVAESWIRVSWMLDRLHAAVRSATLFLFLDCCREVIGCAPYEPPQLQGYVMECCSISR